MGDLSEQHEKSYTIYCLESPNGKRYVGMTSRDVKKRWNYGTGYWGNELLNNDICYYGWDKFEKYILFENLDQTQAENKEIELIKIWDLTNPSNGYNKDYGGRLKKEMSEETRHKLSNSLKGRKCPQKAIDRLIIYNKTRVLSEETHQKMSESAKRRIKEHPIILSEEGKERMRQTKIGNQWNCIPVCQYTLDGIFVKEFSSAKKASQELNIQSSGITRCCKNEYNQCGGYIWKYKDEERSC